MRAERGQLRKMSKKLPNGLLIINVSAWRIATTTNGISTIPCEKNEHGAGWTVILRRQDGSVNFYRNWNDYKNGFGNLDGEFFLGLDKIHTLTAEQSQQLLVLLEDANGVKSYEKYDRFAIGNEQQSYELHTLGRAAGSAGDSLRKHFGLKFSTYDRPNGVDPRNCAILYTGAWWYEKCHDSHLTGKYGDNTSGKGINWYTFRGHTHSLKFAAMMIRPVNK
ncbi:ficolin-1-like [Drosophila navojoa]|uniref:ficolin-1-like n=1 Tax=Drosophila navojoa TaxID=7232 RepID=UPI0011BF03E2|nr:ficolin-1-like [Drosophila navojoa]